ncbi:hypothetical protein A5662_10900 [Mycobacteriaceae bacterium 1482268.1]|nr:hypothetical protein A5662_10900 [Mycobacteriaceae bacterium 1482268.1]
MPLCRFTTPFLEMEMFCTGLVFAAGWAFGAGAEESVDAELSESVLGLAVATPGVEVSPIPMPRATASAPMRPMYVALLMVSSPLRVRPIPGRAGEATGLMWLRLM